MVRITVVIVTTVVLCGMSVLATPVLEDLDVLQSHAPLNLPGTSHISHDPITLDKRGPPLPPPAQYFSSPLSDAYHRIGVKMWLEAEKKRKTGRLTDQNLKGWLNYMLTSRNQHFTDLWKKYAEWYRDECVALPFPTDLRLPAIPIPTNWCQPLDGNQQEVARTMRLATNYRQVVVKEESLRSWLRTREGEKDYFTLWIECATWVDGFPVVDGVHVLVDEGSGQKKKAAGQPEGSRQKKKAKGQPEGGRYKTKQQSVQAGTQASQANTGASEPPPPLLPPRRM